MTKAPKTITVAYVGVGEEIIQIGKRLIDLGLALREGLEVPAKYERVEIKEVPSA